MNVKHLFTRTRPVVFLFTALSVMLLNTASFAQQTFTVSGTILDSDGTPLPGANVIEQGTTNGTATDIDGNYSLTVSGSNVVLVVSFIGYATEETAVNGRSSIDITMTPDISALQEIVVVGYGTTKRSELTGAVGSVKAEDLTVFPTANVTQAIQGRVTGVQVSASNPVPGETPNIVIRGVNSPSSGSQPLFVVDGFVNAPVPPAEDIASVEVLKDAATAAIYGSQGSNGVILITTKSGQATGLKVEFNSSYSFQNVINELDLLNRNQWQALQLEVNPDFTSVDPTGRIDTDWQDLLFQTGGIFNNQLSFSGGSEKVKYYVSGTYFDQEGIVVDSDFDRLSLTSNIDIYLTDRLSFKTNIFARRTTRNGVITQESTGGTVLQGAVSAAYLFAPDQGVFEPDGDFTIQQSGAGFNNPVAIATARLDEQTNDNVQANFRADWEVIDGLTLTSTLGYRIGHSFRGRYTPSTLVAAANGGDAEISTGRDTNFLTESYATYTRSLQDIHRIELTLGTSFQKFEGYDLSLGSTVFSTDLFEYWNLGNGSIPDIPSSSLDIPRELFAVYGRFEYSYDSRYILNGIIRRDESSVLSEDERVEVYPSLSFAWNMHNESFMTNVPSISNLKLIGSFGWVANQSVAPGSTLGLLEGTFYSNSSNSPVVAFIPGDIPNENLGWETTRQLNIGLDLGLWENSFEVRANYYKKNTEDLLFQVPLNPLVGVEGGTQVRNIGEVENRGVELGIGFNKTFGDLQWSSDLNWSRNVNEVIELPGGEDIFYTQVPDHINGLSTSSQNLVLREGEPIGVFFGYQFDGIYQEGDNFLPGPVPAEPGEERFQDIASRDENGEIEFLPDGVVDEADRTLIGDPNPDFIFGFNNDFRYKGFDLNIFFQGQVGGDVYNFTRLELENPVSGSNRLDVVADRWTPENPSTSIPKAAPARQSFISDRFVEDGTYVRLKNIALGYTLPAGIINRYGFQRLRLYVSGQNLLTFTDYSGLDPEISYRGGSSVSGLDYGSYPNFRSVTIGLNATF